MPNFLEAEDGLKAETVHPGGRTSVPGPPAAAYKGRLAVDIRANHVRLDAVRSGFFLGIGLKNGIEQIEERPGLLAIAQGGKSPGSPGGGMGVLAAVLANAGKVALDVARVAQGFIERRGEEQQQAVLRAHEAIDDRLHGAAAALPVTGAAEHGPGLGDGVDLAFHVLAGAERHAFVIVGAAVPGAIPTGLFDRGGVFPGGGFQALRGFKIAHLFTNRSKAVQHIAEEPGQPDALSLPVVANAVEAVIPIARAN